MKTTSDNNNIAYAIDKYLERKHLLGKAEGIILELQKIIDAENKKILVKIASARALDEKSKMHLKEILAKRYSAKEVVFSEEVDKKILGGVRIEVNDEVLDLTLQNKIKKLQKYLIASR